MALSKIDTAAIAADAVTSAKLESTIANAGKSIFQADIASTQSISGTTWTKLNFTGESLDTDSAFDTTDKDFTAPAAGKYFFVGRVNIEQMNNNSDRAFMRFYVNNAQPSEDASEMVQWGFNATNDWMSVAVQGILDLDEDDVVDLRIYTNTGARDINTSGSHFSGFRLS